MYQNNTQHNSKRCILYHFSTIFSSKFQDKLQEFRNFMQKILMLILKNGKNTLLLLQKKKFFRVTHSFLLFIYNKVLASKK